MFSHPPCIFRRPMYLIDRYTKQHAQKESMKNRVSFSVRFAFSKRRRSVCVCVCVLGLLWALDVEAAADEVKENKEIGLLCVCGFRCFESLLGRYVVNTTPSPLSPLPPSTVWHSIESISLSMLLPNKSFWVSAALPRSFGWCASRGGWEVFQSRTMRKRAFECVGSRSFITAIEQSADDDDYHRSVYKFHCSHFRRVDIRPIAINYYYREPGIFRSSLSNRPVRMPITHSIRALNLRYRGWRKTFQLPNAKYFDLLITLDAHKSWAKYLNSSRYLTILEIRNTANYVTTRMAYRI